MGSEDPTILPGSEGPDSAEFSLDMLDDITQETPIISEDMLEANRIVLSGLTGDVRGEVDAASRIEGEVVIGEGSRITSSTLRGPLIIGRNCVIEDAFVGPFSSVHDGVEIRGSEVEHSILLEDARVSGLAHRMESSLLGRSVESTRGSHRPATYRFLVGDLAKIEVC